MHPDEGLNMPGAREQEAPYDQESEAAPYEARHAAPESLPPVAEVTSEPAVAALSREAIVRLIDKYEQVAKSGASYSEFCHAFVADLKELI